MQIVKAIILVGNRDFGRCPLASRLPTALWPVMGKPAIERLLVHLADQGIKQAVICGSDASSLLDENGLTDDRMALSFFDETLPMGTAGCIREAMSDGAEEFVIIIPAAIVCPPQIEVLEKAHFDGQSDLTVMLNPCSSNNSDMDEASGIYVCKSDILKHIPEAGYFDIKEGLIPKMLREGKTIHAAELPHHAGNFRNRREYLFAISNFLQDASQIKDDFVLFEDAGTDNIWLADTARIGPEAKIGGPVTILDGATVSSGAVILGPSTIGKKAVIRKDSVVINSIIWDEAVIGSNSQIRRCVVDYKGTVRDNAVVEDQSVPFEAKGMVERVADFAPAGSDRRRILTYLAAGFICIAFLWTYWHGLVDLCVLWRQSDEYSSGLLVPFLALYILWTRRIDISRCPLKPCIWGLFAFAGAQALRFFGLFFMYGSAERLSIVLSVAALILLLFGWKLFRKVSPILLFLCLMLPLPNVIQYYVGLNLQRWATSSAVFCLEVLGYDVIQDGHTIEMGNVTVAVLEACNGLRMITAFFVISGLVVLLVQRKWWEKLVILISSLPIALLCNTIRLVVTAIFFTILKGEYWEKLFHDFGGYAMMPLALAVIVGELWLLAKLTVLPSEEKAIIITRQRGPTKIRSGPFYE